MSSCQTSRRGCISRNLPGRIQCLVWLVARIELQTDVTENREYNSYGLLFLTLDAAPTPDGESHLFWKFPKNISVTHQTPDHFSPKSNETGYYCMKDWNSEQAVFNNQLSLFIITNEQIYDNASIALIMWHSQPLFVSYKSKKNC